MREICEVENGRYISIEDDWQLLGLINEPHQNVSNPLEKLLHFIWKYKLLKPGELRTLNGNIVKIIHPGELNTDSGPDFFNAQIEIGSLTLAGNIELHTRSSDWIKHGHQHDDAYNKLILHAVYQHDVSIEQNENFNVEVLELKEYIEEGIMEKYRTLLTAKNELACGNQIKKIDPIKMTSWLQRMLVERLESKTNYVKQLFEVSNNDYVQTFYILMARNFGFKVNSEPFELLAKSLPLHILLKHYQNLFQLEALLFGTAGFLNEQFKDKYGQKLQNEFEYLKHKYNIKPLNVELWKYLRLRPANFPTQRIAQFALVIHNCPEIFLNPVAFTGKIELNGALIHQHSDYWKKHYSFDDGESNNIKGMGENSIQNICINTLAPYLFFYGKQNDEQKFIDKALNILESVPFEENVKTGIFIEAGLNFKTSSESQGLINLYDNYCKHKHCLNCAVASNLLTQK
jgi:hypothetical protein